jgi:hypothetical protein
MNIISTTIIYLQMIGAKSYAFIALLFFSCPVIALNPVFSDTINVSIASQTEPRIVEPIEFKRKPFSASLYVEYGMPEITHSFKELMFEDANSYGLGLTFNYRFVPWVGLQFGGGFIFHNSKLFIDEYSDEVSGIDSEGAAFVKVVRANDVSEKQSWFWVNVPASLTCYLPIGKMDFYAFGGMEMRYNQMADFEQTGFFSHHGYYEQWGLLLDELAPFGFYSDSKIDSRGDLKPELLFMPYVGGGFIAPGKRSRLYIEGRYYLNSNDPFANDKQSTLFPGPSDNKAATFHKNRSVMNSGEISFGGMRFILGVNF